MSEIKNISIPVHGIEIQLVFTDEAKFPCGTIVSEIARDACPNCERAGCYYDCDQSTSDGSLERDADLIARCRSNSAIDGIESLILAAACAGIDVETPAFLEAIESALDAVANNAD